METRKHGGHRTAASVLILSLWTLAFLGALALAVSAYVSASIRTARAVKTATAGRYAARAGVESAVVAALAPTNAMGLDADRWNNDPDRFSGAIDFGDDQEGTFVVTYTCASADGTVVTNVGVTCEEARINVSRLSDRSVRAMFEHLLQAQGGVDRLTAKQISAAVMDWCDEDDDESDTMLTGGSESEYYATLSPPYACHDGPMDSVHELRLVQGVTPDLFAAIEPYITVHGEGEKIHVNMAAPVVLRCAALAAGIEENEAGALADAVVGVRPQEDLGGFSEAIEESGQFTRMRRLLTVKGVCFRGTAVGRSAGAAESTAIDFVFDGKRNRFLMWYER
jgi:type II secretory pathway component PulK